VNPHLEHLENSLVGSRTNGNALCGKYALPKCGDTGKTKSACNRLMQRSVEKLKILLTDIEWCSEL
jgi:hypothetical protein